MVPCLPGGGARHHSHQVGERFEPSPADRTKERPPQGGCFFWPVSGGRGASAPTGGVGVRPISAMLIAGQCTPISLLVLPKEKRAVHGPKRKNALARSGAVALRARRGSAYRCKRRFGLAFGHATIFCEVGTAVPWRMVRRASGCKDAFDQLLFPRVPLRYALPGQSWRLVPVGGRGRPPLRQDYGFPRSRRGRCPHRPVAEAPSTTGQRQRKEKQLNAMTTPTTTAPSATGRQYRPRRRR